MATEYARMLQRRGNLADLPPASVPDQGELLLALDAKQLYVNLGTEYLRLLSLKDIVNNLTTNDANKVLSATQGAQLKVLIDNLERYVNTSMQQIQMSLNQKQDQILYKGNTAPDPNTFTFWSDTRS